MSETVKNWWIQIPGVTGEGVANDVAGYIEVVDFNLSMMAQVTGIGKSPTKAVFDACTVGLKGDAASALLFRGICGATPLGSVIIKGLKTVSSKPAVFVQYTFSNAYTIHLAFAQDGDGGLAISGFAFVFTTVQAFSFSQNETTGAMEATDSPTYDLPSQTLS
jgi:type VI protein secretion system component Hcp